MTRRTLGAALVTATALAATPGIVAAEPAPQSERTTKPSIHMLEGFSFVPNRYMQEKQRFNKDIYSLKSGATIQLKNRSEEEPHTLSIVSRSDVPKTPRALGGCFEGGVCGALLQAHQFPQGDGDPAVPLLNKGAPGLDVKGDSMYLKGGASKSVKLSAKAGSTLSFICILHPWMQAKITVR